MIILNATMCELPVCMSAEDFIVDDPTLLSLPNDTALLVHK